MGGPRQQAAAAVRNVVVVLVLVAGRLTAAEAPPQDRRPAPPAPRAPRRSAPAEASATQPPATGAKAPARASESPPRELARATARPPAFQVGDPGRYWSRSQAERTQTEVEARFGGPRRRPRSTVSSQSFNSQSFKLMVSNPRTIVYVRFKMPCEISNLPRAGSMFQR